MSRLIDPPADYLALCNHLDLDAGIPYVRDWSAASDFMQLIVDNVQQSRPEYIIECGSGLSTLMLARACQKIGFGKVISLESGGAYASQTRQAIAAYQLEDYSMVIHAPLCNHRVQGVIYQWYSLNDLPELSFDMLVVDGPPGFIQKNARFPVLPLLFESMNDGSCLYLDDASRDDELEVVRKWKELYPDIDINYMDTERGCAVIKINESAG